ncbi:MAG: hypothetical protein P8123_03415, partial [bacterium]
MNTAPLPRSSIDKILGVVLRLLLVALFSLSGAWVATAVSTRGGSAPLGGAIGFAIISLCLLKEKSVLGFCRA